MASHYVTFDEYENVLASTDLFALVATQLMERPSNWKWMIVATHDALQGALVCAVKNTSQTNILKKKSEAKTLNWLTRLRLRPTRHVGSDFGRALELRFGFG